MGFPLDRNIFQRGSAAQQYFARFPLQVAVLFSPDDHEFRDAFKDLFFHLHQLTGDNVAFFAVLDPPKAWLADPRANHEWQRFCRHAGEIGFGMDDAILVHEIARLFRVAWDHLPCLVASPNLWTMERTHFPTNFNVLEKQLTALTYLVQEWGRPNIEQVHDCLADVRAQYGAIYHSEPSQASGFRDFYRILSTRDAIKLDRDASRAFADLDRSQRARFRETEIADENTASEGEETLMKLIGRFVPIAKVAAKLLRRASELWHEDADIARRTLPEANGFDEESLIMLRTGEEILSLYADVTCGALPVTGYPDAGSNRSKRLLDYSPLAMCYWKAFEREINLSVIQAARVSRRIVMPDFFAKYCPLPGVDGKVHLARGARDINQRETNPPWSERHRFLPLGDSRMVYEALVEANHEALSDVLTRITGYSRLPDSLIHAWSELNRIRNKGSHVDVISEQEFMAVRKVVTDVGSLGPLSRISRFLKSPSGREFALARQ